MEGRTWRCGAMMDGDSILQLLAYATLHTADSRDAEAMVAAADEIRRLRADNTKLRQQVAAANAAMPQGEK